MLVGHVAMRCWTAAVYCGSCVMEWAKIEGFDVTPPRPSSRISRARLPSASIARPRSSSQTLWPSLRNSRSGLVGMVRHPVRWGVQYWWDCPSISPQKPRLYRSRVRCSRAVRFAGATAVAGSLHPLRPHPVADFRQVLAAPRDVFAVLGAFVAHELSQVGGPVTQPGHAVDDVHDEMEAIQIVAHHHVERCGRRPLFLVAA